MSLKPTMGCDIFTSEDLMHSNKSRSLLLDFYFDYFEMIVIVIVRKARNEHGCATSRLSCADYDCCAQNETDP
jgi:hypothetical protein